MKSKRRSKKRSNVHDEYKYMGTIGWIPKYYISDDNLLDYYSEKNLTKLSKRADMINGKKVPKGYNSANNLKVFKIKGVKETSTGGATKCDYTNYIIKDSETVDKFKKIFQKNKGHIIKSCKIIKNPNISKD